MGGGGNSFNPAAHNEKGRLITGLFASAVGAGVEGPLLCGNNDEAARSGDGLFTVVGGCDGCTSTWEICRWPLDCPFPIHPND